MDIRLFATDSAGNREEITDLYWFEENQVHAFTGRSANGHTFEFFVRPPASPEAWNVIEGDHHLVVDVLPWHTAQAALHRVWGQAIDRTYSKRDWLALQDAIDGLRRK